MGEELEKLTWSRHESGVVCGSMAQGMRAYMFDLENTLIIVKRGCPCKWWHTSVPEKLCKLSTIDGNVIVISHDAKRGDDEKNVLNLLTDVTSQLKIPVCVLVNFNPQNAKPRTHIWDLFNSHIAPECLHHLVVGHGLVNYKFATNMGCPYKTPNEFFLNAPLSEMPRLKNWNEWLDNQIPMDSSKWGERPCQELILLVGRPVSGKTTLANQVFPNCTILSLETLGTVAKVAKAAKVALKSTASVVIDAPNGTVAERKRYIDCVSSFTQIPVRAIVISIADDVATQLNAYKQACGGKGVATITINKFLSKYEAPCIEEGISEIHTVTSFITIPMHMRALFCTHW